MNNIKSFELFLPEIFIISGILAIILASLILKGSVKALVSLLLTLAFLIGGLISTFYLEIVGSSGIKIFMGMSALDPFSIFFKLFLIFTTILIVLISVSSIELKKDGRTEYFVLIMGMLLGAMLLASSVDMIMMCVAFELVSIPAYLLTCFLRKDKLGNEAGLKYAIYGAVATGIMLFGISIIYGLTGATSFSEIAEVLAKGQSYGQIYGGAIFIAFTFILVGMGYKIAFVPFHFWSPDVYEGAPTPVTAYLSVASKSAGFAVLFRILYNLFIINYGEGNVISEVFRANWAILVSVISAITMTLGNLAALNQKNLKRLLAYSSIAHAGYLLMGVAVISQVGVQSVLLYLVAYLFMNLGAFYILILFYNKINSYDIEDLKGIGWRSPILGVSMVIFLISLTGLPPMFGFIGKFYIFAEVIRSRMYLLALIGIINTVISLYYYARIFKAIWLEKPDSGEPLAVGTFNLVLSLLLAFPTILFGVWWSPIAKFVENSARFVIE